MSRSAADLNVLVASDNSDDAKQVCAQLKAAYPRVRSSTVAASAAADFAACEPDVLVLAFDKLQKSERYYLGLYRAGVGSVHAAPRTVVLCDKEEVAAAFDLCCKDYFDDYVLFWPQSYDGLRLSMSVRVAARQALSSDGRPGKAELLLHAKHLEELERVVADPAPSDSEGLRARMGVSLAGTRPLAARVRALKPLVLVVDDDEFAQELVRRSLDPLRWDVEFAGDARAALTQVRRVRPDLILMDVRLPGIDGVELTRRLKMAPDLKDIPVVMMTSDSRRETLMGSIEAGAAGFVVKPIGRAALEAQLNKLMPR